jgi:preprotein translocase subunit YajC
LWLQPPAHGGGGAAGGGGDVGDGCVLQAGMFALILMMTYFLMIRPEQKRREETEKLLKSLRKGMKVRTTGGILGEIVSMTDHEVILAVADKVRINVLRSHVVSVEPEKRESGEPKDKDDKDAKDNARS